MSTVLSFGVKRQDKKVNPNSHLILGTKENVLRLQENFADVQGSVVEKIGQSDIVDPIRKEATDNITFYYSNAKGQTDKEKVGVVTIATFSGERSRNNAIIRSDCIADAVAKYTPKSGHVDVTILLQRPAEAFAAGSAIARCFPLYTRKTGPSTTESPRTVFVEFVCVEKGDIDYSAIQQVGNSIRLAQRLVDMPPNELNTTCYVKEVEDIVQSLSTVEMQVIRHTDLRDRGYGGLWNVGKAAEHGPALVILSYTPEKVSANAKTVAMVGKGICYDSGGLSIKSSTNMPGMKADMGGSAGILGAFLAAVRTSYSGVLHALLCLAENSVDERSQRPDDVIKSYSGKTIEVNNTDAEGRLVLADGIAHATKHLNPDILIDMATLTGAQSYATGLKHAGVLCNSAEFEALMIRAGRESGDVCFPLLYCPEFLGIPTLFPSQVADMKNSSKERNNAGSSSAGHFIEEHICSTGFKQKDQDEPEKRWAHVDIAYPAVNKDGRGTGYGVALLFKLLQLL